MRSLLKLMLLVTLGTGLMGGSCEVAKEPCEELNDERKECGLAKLNCMDETVREVRVPCYEQVEDSACAAAGDPEFDEFLICVATKSGQKGSAAADGGTAKK